MSAFCGGPVNAQALVPALLLFGATTALLLIWPGALQRQYRRLCDRFPLIARFDPNRALMTKPEYTPILRMMGVVVLVVWMFLLAGLACYLAALLNV